MTGVKLAGRSLAVLFTAGTALAQQSGPTLPPPTPAVTPPVLPAPSPSPTSPPATLAPPTPAPPDTSTTRPAPPPAGPTLPPPTPGVTPPVAPAPAPASTPPPPDPSRENLALLQRRLAELKAARESLRSNLPAPGRPATAPPPETDEEAAKLRQKMMDLILQLRGTGASAAPSRPSETVHPAETPSEPPGPLVAPGGPALNSLALGHSLFAMGNYEGALKAYRNVNLTGLRAEERAPVQYLIASCLRHLGKLDEASALYREVAATKGDPQVADCAQWQLSTIRWRQQLEKQLAEMRQRRLNAGERP